MFNRRKEDMEKKKINMSTVSLTIFGSLTLWMALLFWQDMSRLNDAYADIMQIEAISSTTQRQINMARDNEHLLRDVFVIRETTENALTVNGSDTISLIEDATIAVLAHEVYQQWLHIEEIISVNWNLAEGESIQELDFISLKLARDGHFKAMTDLSNGIAAYTNDLNDNIGKYQFSIAVFVFLIIMTLVNRGLQTRAELSVSKELAEKAQIDAATGLYNRSRCQEIFKGTQGISDQRQPAIAVLDLNDLKKTNDKMGHRVGDELIHTFAGILKDASGVHTVPPFMGRYGGDEFVVYYEDIQSEDEVKSFLKELEFLTKEFNEQESRFQVSYAVGYAYMDANSTEKLTARQLFDKADEAMYKNKEEGKRAKNPNYDKEKEEGVVR